MDDVTSNTKNPNPKGKANILSLATLFYTVPIFVFGHRYGFEEKDLYETLPEHKSKILGDKLEELWNEEVIKAYEHKRSPSLLRVLIKAFGLEFILWGCILAFLECVIKPAQSLALGWFISYYNRIDNEESINKFHAYLSASLIILLTIVSVSFFHPAMLNTRLVGLKIKTACGSLLYRKCLKLSNSAFETTNSGQIVNMISSDIHALYMCMSLLHYVWIGPLQCMVVTYLMYREFGLSSIFGIILIVLLVLFYLIIGKVASKFRRKSIARTDNRVRFMNEIIMGIQIIKFYAWEQSVQKTVALYRKNEMKFIRFAGYVKAIYMSLDILMIHILLYVTVVAYVMFKDNIDAQKYFSLTTFYASLRVTMGTLFPNAIESIGQNVVSMKRINQFLVCHQISRTTLSTYKKKDTIVELCNASASWTESSSNVLTNLDLSINRRSLTAVVGPVGSGKSSFLNMILKELHLTKGNLKVSGTVSYASQQPWLFSSTIYQNILFGQKLNLTRYNDVLKICALEDDLKVFPNSDKTIVGRRGASLSGGQKARINLARAIYKEADIYLLDDPLSALDANIGKHIFYQCIKEFLKDKTVILVTHQMQYLKHVDRVVVLDKGFVKADGGFETLQKESFFKFAKECVEDFTKQSNVKKNEKERVVEENAEQETGKEKKNIETVSKSVYKDYIMAGGNCLVICLMVLLLLITQLLVSGGTYFMTYWVNIKDLRYQRNITFDFDVTDGFGNFNTTTLDYYEQLDQKYFYVYSLIISILVIVTTTRSFLFFKICAKSSEKLHNSMFDSLIRSTMRFFNTNSAGQILNRFANDMNAVDQNVSSIAMDTIQILITAISSMIMITITNYWLCIPAIVVLLLFYFFKLYCTKTSRSLKRLSSVTHSPILEHLTASLQGLRTIRAQGAQTILKKEFDEHQDLYSCAYSLFTTTSQAFGYLLDCICIIFTAIVISSFLLMGNETYGGNVGLAITQSMIALASFQWGIRQSAELENNMTSVERILEYNSIEHEPQLKRKAPKKWPQLPEIKFVDVCFKYNSEDSPVLKNINFTIKPLEKIGIVGRTGSGKSSLVNALFLLSDLSGSIYIDNIDITTLNLQDLRSKISIIPQDPVIFSGSFRKNLDPFDQYQDDDVWKVLEDVKLKDTVASLPDGLHSTVSDGGSNLSVGERQLICLARAILRNNKILVLDEATANVDSETDEVIQRTIRRKFEKCTVLTIAHRVHTIIDSDRIMVVNNGRIVEFDHPNVLMQNCNGYFYKMVQVSGKDNNN